MCRGITIKSDRQCRQSTTSRPIRTIRRRFVAVVPLRQGEGINSVAYEGAKVAEQQRQAYPDVVPSRRAKEAAGWALPTILSSASLRQAREAASTYARLRAMGAVISALMPLAFA